MVKFFGRLAALLGTIAISAVLLLGVLVLMPLFYPSFASEETKNNEVSDVQSNNLKYWLNRNSENPFDLSATDPHDDIINLNAAINDEMFSQPITNEELREKFDKAEKEYKAKQQAKETAKLNAEMAIKLHSLQPLREDEIIQHQVATFAHGTKDPANQKFIMLHDTEETVDALTTAQSWENSNNGYVAAHFVVGKDGTIVQCVDMNSIAHHAGWGGPGNYDQKFGIGFNDKFGINDDMIGTVYLDGYTSYSMNSYSIGIEMVHVNGEDYPEEQLIALDRLIAYIDSAFGGNAGEIIDHKAWRPSNSDTDENFAQYLANYQSNRKHTS